MVSAMNLCPQVGFWLSLVYIDRLENDKFIFFWFCFLLACCLTAFLHQIAALEQQKNVKHEGQFHCLMLSPPHAINVSQDQKKLDSNPTTYVETTDVVPPLKANLDVVSSLNAPMSNVYLSHFPLGYSASSVPPLTF